MYYQRPLAYGLNNKQPFDHTIISPDKLYCEYFAQICSNVKAMHNTKFYSTENITGVSDPKVEKGR